MLTEKVQKRVLSVLQLKRLSVLTQKLFLFNLAHIQSILTFVLFQPFILCTKIILPDTESYDETISRDDIMT